MRKFTRHFSGGHSKTCWSCGNPFIVRDGSAEAIVGPRGRLYCDRISCGHLALLPHVHALQRATAAHRAA